MSCMGITSRSHFTVLSVKSNFMPRPCKRSRPNITSYAPKLLGAILHVHSTTLFLWNSGSMNVALHSLDVVSSPPGVFQMVFLLLVILHGSLLACLAAIILPDAPVSSRHFRVTG